MEGEHEFLAASLKEARLAELKGGSKAPKTAGRITSQERPKGFGNLLGDDEYGDEEDEQEIMHIRAMA
jgi:hypothetical protein